MEALSPRSTNLPLKHQASATHKKVDRHAPPPPAAVKAALSKIHPPPPPAIVTEPGDDGEQYSTGMFLGKGGFAIVYEGRLLRNGRVFALKVVRSEMTQRKMAEKVILRFFFFLLILAYGGRVLCADNQSILVPHRTRDSFQIATPAYCSVSSSLCF